ncbi:MAG: hypothetical protein ISS15_10665 [Alphaproteobacteria bacterium]|nr:hypothetical protein [Alphaproteobacteria bacterium]MBL7098111.1 hypothetical protein [Alphaproteobacteria bacterium]
MADLHAFLHGEIEAGDFRHADHVHMAFEILKRHDFLDAARAYSAALKAIAARAGNPGAYHETITLAFLALIAERGADCDDYRAFAASNAELFDKTVLARWYAPGQLNEPIARKTFVLPRPVERA